jgi:hypothetical protein
MRKVHAAVLVAGLCPVFSAPAKAASAEFDRIKALEGSWRGKGLMHGQNQDVLVTFHVTSGGNAVMETLDPGTPHEMVSLYHDEDGKLSMTHYCSAGNRPHMRLVNSTPEVLELSLRGSEGLSSRKESHMHALALTSQGGTLVEKWTSYAGGKPSGEAIFTLTREERASPK